MKKQIVTSLFLFFYLADGNAATECSGRTYGSRKPIRVSFQSLDAIDVVMDGKNEAFSLEPYDEMNPVFSNHFIVSGFPQDTEGNFTYTVSLQPDVENPFQISGRLPGPIDYFLAYCKSTVAPRSEF